MVTNFLYTKALRRGWDGSPNFKWLKLPRSGHNEKWVGDEILGFTRTYKTSKSGNIWDEWGRRGSEWAHTLGKRRHGLQEGF